MGFFSDVFGFNEVTGQGYTMTKEKLLEIATIQEVTSKHAIYFRERCDFKVSSGRHVSAGIFSMPSVMDLRQHAKSLMDETGRDEHCKIKAQNIVGNARSLHRSDAVKNESGAPVVIQAASQFNFLEFPSPECVPEFGISDYVFDNTQGPACAVACAAGTAYRNYLVPVPFEFCEEEPQRGQTCEYQLNGLSNVERFLVGEKGLHDVPWKVTNGYVESSRKKLSSLNEFLNKGENTMREEMISNMRIGLQENTTVTDDPEFNTQVTQTYNSAMSIGYSELPDFLWQPVAQIVLDATYEATLLAGVIQFHRAKPPPIVFLTKVGGGVFQNKDIWIRQAIERAMKKVDKYGVSLDIRIVHFGSIDQSYVELHRK